MKMLLSGQTSFYFFACLPGREHIISSKDMGLFYAYSEPRPNAKYSCAASVAIAR